MNRIAIIFLYLLSFSPILAVSLLGLFDFYWFFGAILIVICLFNLIARSSSGKKIVFPTYIRFLCCAFVYYLLWAWSQDFKVQDGFYKFLYKNPVLISVFVFLLVENIEISEKFVKQILRVFVTTIVVALVVSCVQAFYNPDFFMPLHNKNFYTEYGTEFGKVRFVSIFGWISQNDYGLSYLPILSIVFGTSLFKSGKVNPILIIMSLVYVILSGGRWIMVGYLIVFFQYISFKKMKIHVVVKYVLLFGGALVIAINLLSLTGYDITLLTARLESKTYESRYLAFELFLKYFPENPWFGTGLHITRSIAYDIVGQSSQIHVGYLSHLVSYGIVGSFFLFGAWFTFAKRLYAAAKKTGYYGSYFGFLTFLAANVALVEYSIFTYGIAFLVIYSNYYVNRRLNTVVEEDNSQPERVLLRPETVPAVQAT